MPKDNQQDSNPLDQKQPAGLKGGDAFGVSKPVIPTFLGTENVDVPPPPIIQSGESKKRDTSTTPTVPATQTSTEAQGTKTEAVESHKQNTQPMINIPPVVTASAGAKSTKKFKGFISKKLVATILGLLVLIGGVGAGVILTQQSQEIKEKASTQEVCSLESSGGCANLDWGATCGTQISGNPLVCSLKDPAQVGSDGNQICQCTPQGSGIKIDLNCTAIKIYQASDAADATTWTLLNSSEYSSLAAGDDVYITVMGNVTENEVEKASIDKARFSVAFEQTPVAQLTWTESSIKKPGTDEYYYKFTLPEDENAFYINAQLHDSSTDTWF
jgi:hypothetical protein